MLDKNRLENGQIFDEEYFEHLLDEIREIRASERKFYQKITDIYATAVDYSKDAVTTREFFKSVQNKLHYAIHGHTAAEVIVERADHKKNKMGLTTWKNAPNGKIVIIYNALRVNKKDGFDHPFYWNKFPRLTTRYNCYNIHITEEGRKVRLW